jgi:DNA-binding LacI/PurR family transcriptional regulator
VRGAKKATAKKEIVTIDLIAEKAGVSKASVSRVLNGSATVSPELKKKVTAVVRRYGYVPNASARRLAGGRSGLVVLLLEETNEEFFLNPFWGQIVQGFSAKISAAGLHPILLIQPKSANIDSLFNTLRASKVDGVAIFSWHRSLTTLEKVLDPGVKVVLGGDLGGSKKYPFVDVDNIKGGFLATNHLLEIGCKRILHITGDLRLQSGRDRLDGYEKALTKANINVDDNLILHGDYTQSKAEELIKDALNKKLKFDAIFAANDQSANGAINILLRNGVAVPKQIKVVGFDDSPIALSSKPTISTVKQPIRELGAEVATSLIDILEGKQVANKLLDVKLVKRESSTLNN